MHGVCRRRPDLRDCDVLDRLGCEVALDLSLSCVRVQRRGGLAILEHRERDGALSTEGRSEKTGLVDRTSRSAGSPCGNRAEFGSEARWSDALDRVLIARTLSTHDTFPRAPDEREQDPRHETLVIERIGEKGVVGEVA